MNARVRIDSIKKDPATQPRELINWIVVQDYADQMKAGRQFEPVTLFADGIETWLADGYHRVYAAQKAGFEEVLADLRNGTKEDAIWFAASANAKHGLPRSNADKRRAVLAALRCHQSNNLSDRSIAEHCGVHHDLVADVRRQLAETDSSQPKRTKGKDGKWRQPSSEKRSLAAKQRASEARKVDLVEELESDLAHRHATSVTPIKSWKASKSVPVESEQYRRALRECMSLTSSERRQLAHELLASIENGVA